MQFLTVSRRRTDDFSAAEFAALVEEEVQRARTLYAEGFIRQIWHRTDIPGACMVVEAESLEQAREKIGTLPMAQAGMLEINVIPLRPYAGFCPR